MTTRKFFKARFPVAATLWLGVLAWLPATAAGAPAGSPLEAFPAAEAGMKRHVISLPPLADESLARVELRIGKTIETDAVNQYFFAGEVEAESIPGWGFTRYILREFGPMGGTLMAVDPEAQPVARFITLGGEPTLVRYNSRVPIVVYVPQDAEVRHRIWHAGSSSGDGARFVQKLVLPANRVAVVAEGDGEARSIGSYSVRLYSTEHSPAPDDTTFFVTAVTRHRDGMIERILLDRLGRDGPPLLVVVIRSAGSGGYLSADAFELAGDEIVPRASVSGLSANSDPLQPLGDALTND